MASATLSDTKGLSDSPLRSDVAVRESGAGEWIERFESVYRESQGELDRIPWAHRRPCPSMLAWLNAEAPGLVRPGVRAAVVGCGLGEDAVALVERGYDVTAFDASPSAIEHARQRHPDHSDIFTQADLLDLPSRLRNRFDLVIEVHTLQALPPAYRAELAAGMASLLTHRGVLLAVARGRDASIGLDRFDGPPYPLTAGEMLAVMGGAGLSPVRAIDDFQDDNSPPVRRLRGAFHRA